MKILQINKFYYLKGGSERHFFELFKLLEDNGHKVIPFSMSLSFSGEGSSCSSFPADLKGEEGNLPLQSSIQYVNLSKFSIKNIIKFFWNYEAVNKLEALIEKEKPDVAHLHNIAHQISPAIIHTLKKHNIPIVQTLHDYKLICPNYKLFSNGEICEKCKGGKYYNCTLNKCVKNSRAKSLLATLEAYLHNNILKTYDKVDKFIAPSKFMKDKCVEFGIDAERIEVINNFVEANFQEVNNKNYLLYFGRLSKEKGLDTIFDSQFSNIELRIVGDGPMCENLKNKIKKEKLSNIKLLGYKTGKELKDLIANAKAIILPSIWYENMPYSMLEAMAVQKVVIVSDIGGMSEIIEDGKNGFLFKSGNKVDLRKVIDKLDNFDLEIIGNNAKKTVQNFDKISYYKKIANIYKKNT